MPYDSNVQLPSGVRGLPSHAQNVYRSAFNFANKKYPQWSEGRKSQYAWGAVKTRFRKSSNGRWVKLSLDDMLDLATDAVMFPELAEWTRAYINDLPDGCFAVIEPDYKSGKTDNKNARHLPYKDENGDIDEAHLRNALARMNQIVPVTGSISAEELRSKAKSVLVAVAKEHNIGDWE